MKIEFPDDWTDMQKARFQRMGNEIEKSMKDGSMFSENVAMLLTVASQYGDCIRAHPEPTPEQIEAARLNLHNAALQIHSVLGLLGWKNKG